MKSEAIVEHLCASEFGKEAFLLLWLCIVERRRHLVPWLQSILLPFQLCLLQQVGYMMLEGHLPVQGAGHYRVLQLLSNHCATRAGC